MMPVHHQLHRKQQTLHYVPVSLLPRLLLMLRPLLQPLTVGINSVPNGAALIGGHAYTVDKVNVDATGKVTSVVLRNPWGVDGAGNDGKNDGYVTISLSTLFAASYGGTAAI